MKAIIFILTLPFIIIKGILSTFWTLAKVTLVILAIIICLGILAPFIGLGAIIGLG